ncbi:MAG: hypothetical protein PHF67_00890 [Candidatus Nanoarchaeia archaeon]|nr:hypothetical protein [Candidatus Nanoarchaeia archaeon]
MNKIIKERSEKRVAIFRNKFINPNDFLTSLSFLSLENEENKGKILIFKIRCKYHKIIKDE